VPNLRCLHKLYFAFVFGSFVLYPMRYLMRHLMYASYSMVLSARARLYNPNCISFGTIDLYYTSAKPALCNYCNPTVKLDPAICLLKKMLQV
jgi:hypothetical protein